MPTIFSTPSFRSGAANSPSGAAAPNKTRVMFSDITISRAALNVDFEGKSVRVSALTILKSWAASKSAAPSQLEASTVTDSGSNLRTIS
jgi:hypothetical protein